jgi:hypothetical protein
MVLVRSFLLISGAVCNLLFLFYKNIGTVNACSFGVDTLSRF